MRYKSVLLGRNRLNCNNSLRAKTLLILNIIIRNCGVEGEESMHDVNRHCGQVYADKQLLFAEQETK